MVARPVEQVLDEVEQCSIGPVQIFEEKHDGAGFRHPLEEEAPRRVEIFPVGCDAVCEPEHVLKARLDPLSLLRVGHVLLDRRLQLRERLLWRVVLGDPGAHPHHLGECPVGDAVAV